MSDVTPPSGHEVFCEFTFEAAHRLPNVPDTHKCARLHGHSYSVEVRVGGELHPELGWVQDFGEIRQACEPVRTALDHRLLNEVEGLENPTSELLAVWIWQRLVGEIPGLLAVTVRETPRSGCTYRG